MMCTLTVYTAQWNRYCAYKLYIYKYKFRSVVVIIGQFAGLCFPIHEPN